MEDLKNLQLALLLGADAVGAQLADGGRAQRAILLARGGLAAVVRHPSGEWQQQEPSDRCCRRWNKVFKTLLVELLE